MRKLIDTYISRANFEGFWKTFVLVASISFFVDLPFRWRLLIRLSYLPIMPVLFAMLVIRSMIESLIIAGIFQLFFRARRKG
jgi:uncharacterized membrane protein